MTELQQTIQSFVDKADNVSALAEKLYNEIKKGSAEHFIAWHNSKATAANRISEGWFAQYLKDTSI